MLRSSPFSIVFLAALVSLSAMQDGRAQGPERGQREGRGGGRFGRGGPGGGMFGGGMFGGFGQPNQFVFLGNPAVQEELGLSADQKESAQKLIESYFADQRKEMEQSGIDFTSFRDLSQEEREKKMSEFRQKQAETAKKLNEKFSPKLAETLKAEQAKRLKEIALQSAGVMALREADVAKTLKLSDEQQQNLAKVFDAADAELRRSFGRRGEGENDFQARFEQMRKAGEERDAKALAVLSEEQRKAFDELKGKPFDLAQLRPRGFGGGGGRRGQGTGRERPPM